MTSSDRSGEQIPRSVFQGPLRYWRVPFVLLWLVLFFLGNSERDYLLIQSTNMHNEAWRTFGIAMFLFGACYIAGAITTGGSPWRFLPVDSMNVNPAKQWFALILTSTGALICMALVAHSFGVL